MKSSVAVTLGAGVFAVVLAGYLISYATTVHDPVEWKNGDLVVQDAVASEMLPIFAADGSGMTQIGVVEVTETGPVVIEVAEKVVVTPMPAFLARGAGGGFGVYRVAALSDEQRGKVVAAARRQLGKPSDYFLRRSWDALYSSELVRLAYGDIGFDLGRLQKFGKVAGDMSAVRAHFSRTWESNEDCTKRNLDSEQCWTLVNKQEVITPASIVADANVTKVFENKAKVQTLALFGEEKAPAAAPVP